MSISGAWISGKFHLPPLARAFVVFDFTVAGRHEPVPIACFVARVRPEGIGVEWRELAPQIVSDLILFAIDTQATRQHPQPAAALEQPESIRRMSWLDSRTVWSASAAAKACARTRSSPTAVASQCAARSNTDPPR